MTESVSNDETQSVEPEVREARAIAHNLEKDPVWLEALPDCPCTVQEAEANPEINDPAASGRGMENVLLPNRRFGLQPNSFAASSGECTPTRFKESSLIHSNVLLPYFHPGAETEFRSAEPIEYQTQHGKVMNIGQQCTYDKQGELITEGPGAGTPDSVSPEHNTKGHYIQDVRPWNVLGVEEYNQTWQPNQGDKCDPLSELSPGEGQTLEPNEIHSLESYAGPEINTSMETAGETASPEAESQNGTNLF